MNLTLHLVKKDLRSLRLPALLWLGVILGEVGLAQRLLSPASVDMNWFLQNSLVLNLLLLIGLVVAYFVAAMLVLEDPLVGTQMFWATRPISGRRLLGGKVATAALLFGLLPVLVWLPWWFYCGFRPGEMLVAAGHVVALHALVALVALAIASLVDQLARFLLCGLVLVVGLFVIALNMASRTGISNDVNLSRILLAVVVLVLACGAALVRQYLTRRTVSNAVLLLAGAMLAVTLNFSSPFNFRPLHDERTPLFVGTDDITGEIQSVRLETTRSKEGDDVNVAFIAIKLGHLPAGIALMGGRGSVELRWADGAIFRREDAGLEVGWWNASAVFSVQQALGLEPGPASPHHWDPETEAKRVAFREEVKERQAQRGVFSTPGPVAQPKPGGQIVSLRVEIPPSIAARLRTEAPTCQLSLRINCQRPELLGEMPVKSGASLARGGRVELIGLAPVRYMSNLGRNRPSSYLATVVAVTPPDVPGRTNIDFYLVDREHSELGVMYKANYVAGAPIAATITCMPFDFQPPQMWRTDKWVEAPGWQETSRLAAVIFRDVGVSDRNFRTDRLQLVDTP